MHNSVLAPPRVPTVSRNVLIAGSVLVLHAAALWALQSGLLRRAVEVIVPVELLSSIVTPPAPVLPTPPAPPAPPAPQPEKPKPVVQRPRPAPTPAPAPMPVAAPSPAPAPQAPIGVAEPQPPAPPITAPMAAAPAPAPTPTPAPAPPPVVQLPSTNADYLQNPPPDYPPLSRRLREEGKVLLHVQISSEGVALDAQVKRSSGYDRLDRAALEAVRKWRYVPGKRGGVPETMWFDVPVDFVLNRSQRETR